MSKDYSIIAESFSPGLSKLDSVLKWTLWVKTKMRVKIYYIQHFWTWTKILSVFTNNFHQVWKICILRVSSFLSFERKNCRLLANFYGRDYQRCVLVLRMRLLSKKYSMKEFFYNIMDFERSHFSFCLKKDPTGFENFILRFQRNISKKNDL